MKYLINNENEIITGDTFEALVAQLRNSSKFAANESLGVYMAGFAERYEQTTGIKVSTDNAEKFILDLVNSKYLQ